MKFTRTSTPHLGVLKGFVGQPELSLETPLVLLHTQAGHVPHITHEVLKLVSTVPHILQIPIVSMQPFMEALSLYQGRGGVGDFVGNTNGFTCVTLHDPSIVTKCGHHGKDRVPLFTKQGKMMIDSKMYMDMIEIMKPDMFTLLSDGDTNLSSTPKRILKSVETTTDLTKQCLERWKNIDNHKEALIVAPIAGGYCQKSRIKSITSLKAYDDQFGGYLIDGLHNNGPEVELVPFTDIEPIIKTCLDNMNENKLRMLQGCWSPLNVIKLVKQGIDVFDTTYCYILTERSAALTISFDNSDDNMPEINLKESKMAEDFRPIVDGCQCLTCQGYTRGYIHHLLTVKELLGPVLIMIHNLHYMLKFFEIIRQSIKDNSLDCLEDIVLKQSLLSKRKLSI